MKKAQSYLIAAIVVILLVILLIRLTSTPKPGIVTTQPPAMPEAAIELPPFPETLPEGVIVFDLAYRGLGGGKDELRYNSYWGVATPKQGQSKFIEELRKSIPDIKPVYNQTFASAEWSGVELKDNQAVAFYFDTNADGKVQDDEKFLPVMQEEYNPEYRVAEFVTPDFVINTANSKKISFRALLRVGFYGKQAPQFMWSPSCVMEGKAQINGEPVTLILYARSLDGVFTQYRRCYYSLWQQTEKTGQYIPKYPLSSLISYKNQFYRLRLYGGNEQDSRLRAVLEKDTTPTGELAIKLAAEATNLKTTLSSANISGSDDESIVFDITGKKMSLPAGKYKLNRGYIRFAEENSPRWNVSFTGGPVLVIEPQGTFDAELGKPTLAIKAVDEKERYKNPPTEKSAFAKGTKVYLSPVISGKTGEVYSRFTQTDLENKQRQDKNPVIKIVDSEGKELVNAKMEYG